MSFRIVLIHRLPIKSRQTENQANLSTKQDRNINKRNRLQTGSKTNNSRIANNTLRSHTPISRKFTPYSQSRFRASLNNHRDQFLGDILTSSCRDGNHARSIQRNRNFRCKLIAALSPLEFINLIHSNNRWLIQFLNDLIEFPILIL